MILEFIKIDKILNNTLFKAKYDINFHNYYISDGSIKIFYQNPHLNWIYFRYWTFYFEDTKRNEEELLIKNEFYFIKFDVWNCCKLYSKVNFEENYNYELHDSDITDFIINFFKDTTFENYFEIMFDDSFNYPNVAINSSNFIKLLNKSDTEISDILKSNLIFSEFNNYSLDKLTGIDHIEIHTYLNNYTIDISKLGNFKFNCYLTSTSDSSFEIPALPSFRRKSFGINWKLVEFKVNDEYFIYIGEIPFKYLMMNSRNETAELFDRYSFEQLNLDFVARSLGFTFITDYDRDRIIFKFISLM